MQEVKLHDSQELKLSLFRDNHTGVVVQLYRSVETLETSNAKATRKLHAVWTRQVSVTSEDGSMKNPNAFKDEVQQAIDLGNKELAKMQKYDHLIDGVLNDYGSQKTQEQK